MSDIARPDKGSVEINSEECKGCGLCVVSCALGFCGSPIRSTAPAIIRPCTRATAAMAAAFASMPARSRAPSRFTSEPRCRGPSERELVAA